MVRPHKRPAAKGPRPQIWKIGPDPVLHQQWKVWGQQKNQAQWRGEQWDLSFDDWRELWGDLWHNRGRERGDYCMTRRDWSTPWTRDNAVVITRIEHAKMQGAAMSAGWRSVAQKKKRTRLGLDQ